MNKIQELLALIRPSAPVMTKALSDIGNGDMHTGIKQMYHSGLVSGNRIGIVKGAVGAASLISMSYFGYTQGLPYLRRKIKEFRDNQSEKKRIVQALEETVQNQEEGEEDA